MKKGLLIILGCIGSGFTLSSAIADNDGALTQLKRMSLEALMNVKITIAGKTPQKPSDIPASVYVVTQEDIKSMGATNIPEALRLVPGMQVAQIDANKWAISIRGFSGLFSSKLLVMIDGRTVYTPLYSGVHWDVQDTMLEDIERIEVVRGPGASVWGANAVNGVINIITKKVSETQGTLLTSTVGTEQWIASVRHGGKLANNIFYRSYGKYRNQDNGKFANGSKATDGWHDVKGGFRVDWDTETDSQFTIQGDIYTGKMAERVNRISQTPPDFSAFVDSTTNVWGANLLARWTKNTSKGASQTLQAYYDYTFRDSWLAKIKRGTFDLDYKYQFAPARRHSIVAGAGYRFIHDEIAENSVFIKKAILRPNNKQNHLFSAFFHDDITLIENTVWLTLGSKLEHNDYSGFEIQPSARLRWQPMDKHLLWASVSRAVRTPSRSEQDSHLIVDQIFQPGIALAIQGNKDFDSEELLAYEIGYRTQAWHRLNFDINLFYNDYKRLQSIQSIGLAFPAETAPLAVIMHQFNNQFYGETYGVELAVDWQPTEKWKLRTHYSYIDVQLHNPDTLIDQQLAQSYEKQTAKHQLSLLSSYQLSKGISFHLFSRYVDRLPQAPIASHFDIDIGLHWQASKNLSIALYGRNLVQPDRFEYKHSVVAPVSTKVERQGYLAINWRL